MKTKESDFLAIIELVNDDPETFVSIYPDSTKPSGYAQRYPKEWGIRFARFFSFVKESEMMLLSVTRFSINSFVVDSHTWLLKPEEIRLSNGKFRWMNESVRYSQYGANCADVNRVINENKEITAGEYQQMLKVFTKTIHESLEAGKTGRSFKAMPGDSIEFE